MMLQSLADGSCLTDAPLRFETACAEHWSNATATELRLGKYWSNATATELRLGKYHFRFDGAVRSAAGRRLWLREPKLCADPWCLRCVGRTHGNRATLRPCVLGFERLRPATALAIASTCPKEQAAMSGVPPVVLCASTAAPFSSSSRAVLLRQLGRRVEGVLARARERLVVERVAAERLHPVRERAVDDLEHPGVGGDEGHRGFCDR